MIRGYHYTWLPTGLEPTPKCNNTNKENNMIHKFRKKPVVVEAEQFVVWNNKEVPAFTKLHDVTFPVYKNDKGEPYVIIPTLEGQHIASNLDWVIKGVKGELYPCKLDIFEKTYEQI